LKSEHGNVVIGDFLGAELSFSTFPQLLDWGPKLLLPASCVLDDSFRLLAIWNLNRQFQKCVETMFIIF
jgi:hypothetical protein